jgi:hypothetical protein
MQLSFNHHIIKGKDKVIYATKKYRGSRGIAPLINVGARYRWVVSLTLRPICSQDRTPVLNMRLC